VRHAKLGEYKVVGQPINLSRYPQPAELKPTPELGEHTAAILGELGYGAADVERLRKEGVV
jgi:crotonobetainyl-CoA:carnitine CoA-transferase CaiB-like acyl-CoA transferase